MSDASPQVASDYKVPKGNPWQQAWKIAAVIGAVGVVMAGAGYAADPRRFAFAYLMGFAAVMTVALGSVFFIIMQHLTAAGWSVTVRRTAELLASGMVIVPILFLPNLLSTDVLYPWWQHHEEGVAHAQEHADEHGHGDHGHDHAAGADADHAHGDEAHAAGHEGHDPAHAMHQKILEKKLGFLNQPFFIVRLILYFAIWMFVALRFFRYSTAQDANGDPQWTLKAQRFAPAATFLFGFSLTFAAFDWLMSMEPNWYSTMFGVRTFAASILVALALIILITLGLKRAKVVGEEISVEHYHDLGKLMFGFLIFWAYVSFSEFMLIWYAAIPEETAYYHRRWDFEWWRTISIAIVVVKFIIPFYLVMSRNAKRNLGLLGLGAGWICFMHLVELYYWVMPYYADGADVSLSITGLATDIGCYMATLGIYFAVVFRRMLDHPVIPIRDPRIGRALHFVNA